MQYDVIEISRYSYTVINLLTNSEFNMALHWLACD